MSSPIEEAAVEFIDARRKKLEARYRRNGLLAECKEMNESTASCSFNNDNESSWCEKCKAAKRHSTAFQRRKDETNNALKKLERRVNKSREKHPHSGPLPPCPFCGQEPENFANQFATCKTVACVMYGRNIDIESWKIRRGETRSKA